MNFYEEFEIIYAKVKKNDDEAIDAMNDFCSKWDGIADIEHIPYFMKLYFDESYNCEQNEFVTNVIDSILKRKPIESATIIINNLNIFYSEDSIQCISYICTLLIPWNKELISYSAKQLAKSDNAEEFINTVTKRCNSNSTLTELYKQFLQIYNEEIKKTK